MQPIAQLEGTFTNVDGRYVIVVGRFNHHVVDSLVEGAVDSLVRHGVDEENIDLIHVPGAWEIPLAVKAVLAKVKPVEAPAAAPPAQGQAARRHYAGRGDPRWYAALRICRR